MKFYNYTKEELQIFFLQKRYSAKTKQIIMSLFLDEENPSKVAEKYQISPQRVNNIKKEFLNEYKYDNYITFEGQINSDNIEALKTFAKECNYLKIVKNTNPSRKIYI